jgi:hypothetical protein
MSAVEHGRRVRAAPRTRLAALFAYAVAMGWLEAVVVVYIRNMLGIGRTETIPPPREVLSRIHAVPWLMFTEQTREIATLIMLLAVAWLGAQGWRSRFGAFLICFGVWDISYYAGLYALLGWPPSFATLDLLFLIPPHPWWYQPVWLPIAISCAMIVTGSYLQRAQTRAA